MYLFVYLLHLSYCHIGFGKSPKLLISVCRIFFDFSFEAQTRIEPRVNLVRGVPENCALFSVEA